MSRRIILRPSARRDLTEIWKYTEESWDANQAAAYARELESAIERLSLQPGLGSDRDHVRPGLRKLTVASHAIYYFHDEQILRVSRILHVRMDIRHSAF